MSKPFGGRIAIVGTGSRAAMFVRGIVERPETSRIVALCEPNTVRAAYYNDLLKSLRAPEFPVYPPDAFKEMLQKEKVEAVVITCIDALHDLYIVPALEAGVRVLTEKPMTTDAEKCCRILDTVNRTNSHIIVTFNYRYNPVHELIKRTIAEGKIGKADYFRRWHRQKENSGGLMVHKSGHHFDLVNWWIDAKPVTVAAMGGLTFYGDKAGKASGWARDYERARGSEAAKSDPFAINLEADPTLKKIYADAESVFAPGIGIEDDMSLLVKYNNGATMTYHLLPVKVDHGSHGGGDTRMLSVLFGPLPGQAVDQGDAAKQGATERDGALALAVGLLANKSFKSGKFEHVKDLELPL
ncbi:hypothetical protein PLEOSDRAFT_185773 [Pleurotus ostreatus PC15]|uniref:Gfo/Idh/MocA-like oxidoreductase N-terminal domain-containing protein n=1 Tax=Pleurotus ostreatus (strain PC15) TaxID=1137138 RepID=A0A067P0X2_PLEO1|nr:hypothetical protein PLEOSDRAFT_185773 [Pleurotus ostreatus PC15]